MIKTKKTAKPFSVFLGNLLQICSLVYKFSDDGALA